MEGIDQRLRRHGRGHLPQTQRKLRMADGASGRVQEARFPNPPGRRPPGLAQWSAPVQPQNHAKQTAILGYRTWQIGSHGFGQTGAAVMAPDDANDPADQKRPRTCEKSNAAMTHLRAPPPLPLP